MNGLSYALTAARGVLRETNPQFVEAIEKLSRDIETLQSLRETKQKKAVFPYKSAKSLLKNKPLNEKRGRKLYWEKYDYKGFYCVRYWVSTEGDNLVTIKVKSTKHGVSGGWSTFETYIG